MGDYLLLRCTCPRLVEQKELALTAGLSKDLVWRWESGMHGASERKLAAVADVLGVESEYLRSGRSLSLRVAA